MSQNNLSEKIFVSNAAKQVLAAGEKVIDKFDIMGSAEIYATNKRVFAFGRPEFWAFIDILGLMVAKKYTGSVEYSSISEVALVKVRPPAMLVAALIVFLACILGSIPFLVLEGAAFIGFIFIALGVVLGGLMLLRKFPYYQLKINDSGKNTLGKILIPVKEAESFVATINKAISKSEKL
jgi:hypothetical protein